MELLASIFSVENVAFEIFKYKVSYIELIGTLFGIISAYLASQGKISTWATGILSVSLLIFLFFQVSLYADMFLHIYFLISGIYGWYNWKIESKNTISKIQFSTKIWILSLVVLGTVASGFIFLNIHKYLPEYFTKESVLPFIDSFIMVMSMVAMTLLTKKKIEAWYFWIVADITCVFLFLKSGTIFLAIEYLIFLGIATYGLINWRNILKNG